MPIAGEKRDTFLIHEIDCVFISPERWPRMCPLVISCAVENANTAERFITGNTRSVSLIEGQACGASFVTEGTGYVHELSSLDDDT